MKVEEIVFSKKRTYSEEDKTKNKADMDKLKKAESKLVKGIFKNLEAPGCNETFALKLFPGEPVRHWTFEDGETCDVPLYVAKHINSRCKYKRSKWLIDPSTSKRIIGADKPIQRFAFISTEFQEIA